MQGLFLGIDVGSVSTNMVLVDESGEVQKTVYIRTEGKPISAVQTGLQQIKEAASKQKIAGVSTTGSARQLTGLMVGADLIKNEITTHAVAAMHCHPDVKTIIEIGGQDSKIVIIREGVAVDFAMNTVCAAGTGSFLDQQAARLGLKIEEFSRLALQSESPVSIAGRCAVFAESDMIHKQQIGHSLSDIIAGLCEALVRNYLNNVAKGKEILSPVIFQGGVAANLGIRKAMERALGVKLTIPEHFSVMGALGAALLVREQMMTVEKPSNFAGWQLCDEEISTKGHNCTDCSNNCEIIILRRGQRISAYFGDRCGKWSSMPLEKIREEQVG